MLDQFLFNPTKDVPFSLRTSTIDNYLVKALCVDAIVDAGDTNSDWRLDFHEFQKLAEPNFQAKEKRTWSSVISQSWPGFMSWKGFLSWIFLVVTN